METAAIIVPTFSNDIPKEEDYWSKLAKRALDSAYAQTVPCHVIYSHSTTNSLADARNLGAVGSKEDWLIFLDADDELDPHYVEAMLAGSGDMRWPSTIGVHADGHEDDYPVLLQPKGSLLIHNWMVVGTMIRKEQFFAVGGFYDLPILEDWDLFIRLVLAGAKPEPCPDALYRVHVREGSRNNPDIHGHTYTAIQQLYQTKWHQKGLA